VGALLVESLAIVVYLRDFVSRPLAFDEQWRAYFISLGPDIVHRFDDIPAPMSAGWTALEWLNTRVLPNNEMVLRLPQTVALAALAVATYVLSRRWLPVLGAWAVAAALLLNGPLLVYGMLMKPFVFEAMCGVLVLVGWLWLQDGTHPPATHLLAYAGIGLATVFAASAIFLAIPLLALGLWRQRRGPVLGLTLAGSAVTAVIAGLHMKFFFLRQGQLLKEPYWQSFFVPHSSQAVSFLVDQAKAFARLPSASFLSPDTADQYLAGSIPPVSALAAALGIAFVVLVAWGVVVAARTATGRALLAALFGALAIQFVASWLEKWPFGMVRVNLVLVPLLYVVIGLGVADLVRRAMAVVRPPADPTGSTGSSGAPTAVAGRVVVVGLAVVALLSVAVAIPVEAKTVRGFEARYSSPLFVDRIRDAVAVVRSVAGPDDVVVAVLDHNGWAYYSLYYDDAGLDAAAVARVPADHTLQVDDFLSPEIKPFVEAHPTAQHVVVFNFMGISPEYYDQQAAWMAERNLCPTRRWDFDQTGIVTEYTRVPDATHCPDAQPQPVSPLPSS
jgi:hypothetical protein